MDKLFEHGAKSSIGTSAVVMTDSFDTTKKGVLIKASNENTGIIYVGDENVTAGTTDATDGFELGAGESIELEIDNPGRVYLIASDTGQKVFWMGV